ncbi:MAG: zinc ribbon domain-containing protein [Candidatus Heimdallarchaeota archaeon]|nr:MAG: zinc ribbon domain-containing protein [Candidatus Heimdallarchaeota archaeon]
MSFGEMNIIPSNSVKNHRNRLLKRTPFILRIISLIALLCLIILLSLSWISNWDSNIWILTQYLSPLLFLGIWIPFAGSFLILDQEISSLKKTFPSIIFGSVLVVLGALLLNTRLLFVILDTITGLFILEMNPMNEFVVNELIVGIILPLNEEIMKIIPIIVVAQSPIVLFNPEKSDPSSDFEIRQSIKTLRQFGFYGIVSGTIFTFLELFLYQWLLTGGSDSAAEAVFLQLLFRTLTPLHVLTTFLMALGIGSLKIQLAEHNNVKSTVLASTGYFLLGWGFHSFWNTINVVYEAFRPEAEIELYTILAFYGVFCVLLLFSGIIIIFRRIPRICPTCGLEGHDFHSHKNLLKKIPGMKKEIFPFNKFTHISVEKLKKNISCPFCHNPLILGTCSTCGASSFVTCPHCNGFISETTSLCPHCNKKIRPLIQIRATALSRPETFILGVTSLASIAFLLAPLSILILSQFEGGLIVSPILIFYFLMSIITLSNVLVALLFNRTSGMLVLFSYFLVLALLIFVIINGFVIIGFFRALITGDFLGLGIVCLGGGFLLFIVYRFVYVFIFNYSPMFPEYRIKLQKEVSGDAK